MLFRAKNFPESYIFRLKNLPRIQRCQIDSRPILEPENLGFWISISGTLQRDRRLFQGDLIEGLGYENRGCLTLACKIFIPLLLSVLLLIDAAIGNLVESRVIKRCEKLLYEQFWKNSTFRCFSDYFTWNKRISLKFQSLGTYFT